MTKQDPNRSSKKADGSPKGDNRQAGDVDGNSGAAPGTTDQTGAQSTGNKSGGNTGRAAVPARPFFTVDD